MPEKSYIGTTSIVIAKQQTYSINLLKRPTNSDGRSLEESRVFGNTSNITSALNHHKRQRSDQSTRNRIAASGIVPALPEDSIQDNSRKDLHNQTIVSTPGATALNPLLFLSHPSYGLPAALVKNFASLGIKSIYPWQSSCLLGRGLLTGEKNLVYTAPTGGGKSLVADVLMLKRVIENQTKKAIIVLPYVALVQEKLKWLRKVVEGVTKNADPLNLSNSQLPKWRRRNISNSVRVAGFFGGSKTRATWSDVDVAVCTIEKVHCVPLVSEDAMSG